MRKLYLAMGLALVAMFVAAGTVFAAVTFDPATGTGFVGKGDVQTALNLNNAQLQAQAGSIKFRALTVSERSWTCTNSNNENTQVRERTTEEQRVASHIVRERNQITGFNLTGYTGDPIPVGSDGPPLNSCPSGPWTLTTPAGNPVVISSTLQVSKDGTNFVNLS